MLLYMEIFIIISTASFALFSSNIAASFRFPRTSLIALFKSFKSPAESMIGTTRITKSAILITSTKPKILMGFTN
jgi:hypothetical protein